MLVFGEHIDKVTGEQACVASRDELLLASFHVDEQRILRPADVLNHFTADTAAAADGKLHDVALLERGDSRPVLVQHTLHELFINRLAAGKLRNDEGDHGGDGEGEQLLVGSRHFHNQHGACDGRTHGRGEERRHRYDHDVRRIDGRNPAQENEHLSADAAAEGTDDEHGQKEAAGYAAAIADEREEQLACEKDEQQLQGDRCFGKVVDEAVAAAEYLR